VAEERVARANYPWWVKLSLLGVPGRGGLWAYVAICLAAGVGSVVFGLHDARFKIGGVFALGALPYWLSIRWIDRHGSWDDVGKS
jgi:hypothetical protein